MKSKKKIRIYSFLTVFLVLSFVLVPSFNAFATSVENFYYRTFNAPSFSFSSYYQTQSSLTPLSLGSTQIDSIYSVGDTNLGVFCNTGSADSFASVWATEQENILFYSTYTGQTSDGNYTPLEFDLTTCNHVVFSYSTYGNPYNSAYVFYICPTDSNQFAFVDNYLVSDKPFYIFQQADNQPFGNDYSVFSASANGFYCASIDSFAYTTSLFFMFSDIDIFLSSVSGGSGFTSFSESSTDFSFSDVNSYVNFNYQKTGGDFIDPNAPLPDPDETSIISPDGLNYVYGTVEVQFSGAENGFILATYDFKLNPYMLAHPEEYSFHMDHTIKLLTTSGDDSFLESVDINISDILAHNDQVYNRSIPFSSLLNNNDQSLTWFLRESVWNSIGLNTQYYNNGSVLSYGRGTPSGSRTFGKFTLGVSEPFINLIESAKFYYSCYFVWHGSPETRSGKLSGWKDLISKNNRTTENSISNNAYPPSDNLNNNYPSIGSGGTSGGTSGGNVNVVVNNGSGFTPFTLDDVSYANVKSMFNDIKDFVDSTSENSFWAVLKRTFDYLPDAIWTYIIISVAVICGFSVARYVLRR